MTKKILTILLLPILCVLTASATAHTLICMERDRWAEMLRERHGELPAGAGLALDGTVYERFESRDGTTWSMLITHPNGRSCVIGAGTDWVEDGRFRAPQGPQS